MRIIRFDNKGWRSRFDDGFNEQNLGRIADAFGYIWADAHAGATIYVGYDTRYNGRGFAMLVAGVLASYGLKVILSDAECPTPALGWSIAQDPRAVGGVMLTASGASCEYGGVSARAADGGPVSDEFYDAASRVVPSLEITSRGSFQHADIMTPYLRDLVGLVDAQTIAKAELDVVVDPMHGSAKGYLASVLRELGCKVHEIRNNVDTELGGIHPTPCEPWTDKCEQAVVTYGSDLGIVLDGDGDRMGAITKGGRLVSPHMLVPLLMEHLVQNRAEWGRVVVTHSSSAYVRRQAQRLGIELTSVPVGFTRIYGEFVERDVILGAEEYGGICVPDHLPERDGLLAALLLIEYVAVSAMSLDELQGKLEQEIGPMHYIRRNIRLDVASIQSFRNILPGINLTEVCGMRPVAVGHSDGLILRFANDSWVQLRPSRTEALVRACAEAPDLRLANELADEACKEALRYLPK